MSVSNMGDFTMRNGRFLSEWRFNLEDRAVADTAITVLAVESAPVQLFTTSGTGPAVVRLPLAAKQGTVFFIVNDEASTQSITVTDDAGSPNTIVTLATDTSGMFIKVGDAWRCMMESAAMA